jgi:hypothetical protein
MRMRAAYDEEQAAVSRLRSAAQMASAHGSVALLRRCEHELTARGVRLPAQDLNRAIAMTRTQPAAPAPD